MHITVYIRWYITSYVNYVTVFNKIEKASATYLLKYTVYLVTSSRPVFKIVIPYKFQNNVKFWVYSDGTIMVFENK